ncbi:GDSL-type esterase/lipase family protein [uncultured Prevotella sp.]|uniref:rhamnogalacturonan acetylesterase n=1 Tax=uncultured Prevotella sp. TaxID=159272 RepID=UPI002630F643|nr:GDSL-type esterase/lipase family protein [uncultured Prevotella sp.]
MDRIKYLLVLFLCVLSLSAYKDNDKITIFMIGDSTMANKDIRGGKMERGWGMMLKNFFTEDVIVDNHALNGRSSKSFISEGHWQKVVEKIKPGDYVFIQFGHNDEKDDPKRHTDPGTTFDENLRKFVKETRMRGGIPVLFNSVVRRIFTNSTTAVADDDTRSNSSAGLVEGDTLVDTHGDYLLSPRNVARELDVPFVDANKITHDLEQGLGPDKSKKLHMWYLPNEIPSLPKGRQDNTHYNVYGAYVVAGLLADAVSDVVPELKQYRCKYDITVAKDGSGLYFDLQKAVDNVPSDVKTAILIGEGKWKKPVVGKDKKIEYIMRQGASFIK